MAQELYYAGEVALWLQRECGDAGEFLGCHNLTGVSVPKGESNPTYCRIGKRKFKIKRTWRGTPGLGSATIVAYDTILNLIQELPCAFNLFVLHSACGADEDPINYDYLYIYNGMEPTSEDTDTHVVGMTPDDETPIMLSMPTSFTNRVKVKKLNAQSIDVSAITTADINAISFCDDPECGDICGDASVGCQTGFFVTDGDGGVAVIGAITNGGTVATIASPFTTATDDIKHVKCTGDLVIVTNGISTSYAYSWDGGATFTEITGLAQIANRVLIYGGYKIWMVGAGGYVWYSSDRGATMTVQDAGVATGQSLNDIDAASSLLLYAVGDNNAFTRTEDGGDIWTAVAGPAGAIFPNDLYRVTAVPGTQIVFVGDEQGNVYRSEDMGDTWATVMTGYATLAGGIYGIAVPDCNVVAVIGNDEDPYFYASGVVGSMYQSVDGGNSWQAVEIPVNTGLRGIWACSVNEFWIVGDAGLLAKVAGPGL